MTKKLFKKIKKKKRVLLDMSCSLIHHGHIRLIKKAAKYGDLIISLTTDKDLKNLRKYNQNYVFLTGKKFY